MFVDRAVGPLLQFLYSNYEERIVSSEEITMFFILNIDHPPGVFSASEACSPSAQYNGVRSNQREWHSLIESRLGEVEGVDFILPQLKPYLKQTLL